MLRTILAPWRTVALAAALLALAAAPACVQAAGHAGGSHGGGSHAGGFHAGGYHAGGFNGGGVHYGAYNGGGYHSGYNSGYFSGYHNGYSGNHDGYGYDHRGYGYYGGYYSPWFYGSPAYISGGSDATSDYSDYYAPDYVAPAVQPTYQYTPYAAAPASAPNATALESTPGLAVITVHVPADAEVWFDDSPTRQTGEQRQYISPTLEPGKDFNYDVRARWTDAGKVVDETRRVAVHANGEATVDFTQPAPTAPASK